MKTLLLATRRVLHLPLASNFCQGQYVALAFVRLAILCLAACFLSQPFDVQAQVSRAFTVRYSTNDNGDIKLIGNTVMTCSPAGGNCALAQAGTANPTGLHNQSFLMVYVDVDADASTFNSSEATLAMPPGSTVKFAGLYWGGRTASVQRGQVLFRTPSSFGYSTVTATTLDAPLTGQANNYSAAADVTAAVAAAGNGVYTIANVQSTQSAAVNDGYWGGWMLVVVYQNPADTLKNLVVYDGYALVSAGNSISLTPSGFLTPLSGPVTTRVGAAGYDGDLSLVGDEFRVNGVQLVDALNTTNDFFNSVISENGVQLPGRNPSFTNNFGVDVDRVNVPTGVVPNGATTATISLATTGENYHPNLVTFVTDLYVPIITQNVTKTVSDVNGAPLLAGDVMRWTIAMSNTGQDTGTNLILKDPIPTGTTYVPGSLLVISGANAGAKTDAVADDQAEFSNVPANCSPVASPCVIFRLGTGATGAAGGNLAFGQATSLSFDTTVNAGLPAGTQITNSASISYSGQTLGATFSTTSASASGTVANAPTIAKSFTPAIVNVGGTSTLTVVLANPAGNPITLNGVTFTDTYPAGITNSATPVPNVVCSGGSSPGTVTGGVALGNTIGMSPGATILAGGNCTITVQVIATAAGALVNTTGNVTSTNGGTGTTASATLFAGKVSITKAFSAPTFEVGQNSTITFVLTNNTGVAVTGLAFSDSYPGGMTNTATAPTNTCGGTVTAANGTTTLTLTGGAALGIGASCTITKQVVGTAGGAFTNTTTGVTRTGDAVPGNPASAAYTVVAAPTIVKTFSPNPVNNGDLSTLSIMVTNPNTTTTVTRAGAVFLDTYPANLRHPNAAEGGALVTINCTAGSTTILTAGTGATNGTTLGLSNMTLDPGGSCTVTSLVRPTSAGDKTNPAFVATFDNAPDPTAAAAILTVTTLNEPTITKTFVTNPILAGGTSVMRITITNGNATGAGNTLTGISFTDIYPMGLVNAATPNATISGGSCSGGTLTAVAGGNSLTLSGASITATAAADTCQVDVTVTAAAPGAYLNTTGPIAVANSPPGLAASGTLNVLGPPTITKSFSPSAIAAGGSSVLTIVISNPGTNPLALAGVSFTDTFPVTPGVMLTNGNTDLIVCTGGSTAGTLQDPGGGGLGDNDVGLRINPAAGATLLPNGSCTITVTVDTSGVTGVYTNTTSAVVSTGPAQTGGTASATLTVARLGIAKAFAPATIVNGGTSVITFSISNPTGATINGLAFTDALPAGMTMSSATVGGTCTGVTSNANIGVTNFAVTAGTVTTAGCTITISVTSNIAGTSNNQSSGASHGGDPTPGLPSNVATLVVQAAPTVVKSFAPVAIAQNGTSLLTIALTNPNAVAMTAAAFTDTYPAGVANAAVPNGTTTCPGGTVTAVAAGPSLAISGATIPANSTCIVTVNVTSATAGTYINTFAPGTLTSSGGSNLNSASDTLTVLLPPTVTKSFLPTGVAVSENSVLTIILTNPNSTAITGVAFTDNYPANLRNAVVPNASTDCPVGTPTATPNGTNPGVLTFTGGTIPASSSCMVSVSVMSLIAANYTNSTGAITTSNAGSGTSASAILSVGVPSISKIFSPNPVQLGQNSTLTFTITNGTPTPMTGVGFTDTFPVAPGNMRVASPATFSNTCGGTFTPVAAAGSIALSGGSIPADSFCTLTVVVSTPTIGTYNNTSGIVSATGPLNGNAASASLTVTQAVPTVNKIFSADLVVGGSTNLTFTVSQPATNPTQTFSFTDTLPAGLVASGAAVTGTCTGGSVTATAGSNSIVVTGRQITNPLTSCTIIVPVTTAASPVVGACTLAPNANTNSNINTTTNITAAIAPSATSGTTPSAGACVTVTVANLTLTKSNSSGTVNAGAITTYTLTVTNSGSATSSGTITVVDVLPAGRKDELSIVT